MTIFISGWKHGNEINIRLIASWLLKYVKLFRLLMNNSKIDACRIYRCNKTIFYQWIFSRLFLYRLFPYYFYIISIRCRNHVPSRPAICWRKVNICRQPMAGLLGTMFPPWTNKVSLHVERPYTHTLFLMLERLLLGLV